MNKIKLKKKQEIFKSGKIDINRYTVSIKTLNGKDIENSSFCIETPFDAVFIILYDTKTDELIFVKQFRTPPFVKNNKNFLLEFAGGKVEKELTLEENALKEVKEEVGIENVISIQYITTHYANLTILSLQTHLFFAEVDSSQLGKTAGLIEEEGEYIEIEKIKSTKVYEMLENNEITNAHVVVGLEWFFRKKRKS
ncbi:MAG: NUDIX domain-containing protein [Alphaproteobacteria bacterium]